MANLRLFGFWNHLTEGLRSGLPQNEVKSGASSPFGADCIGWMKEAGFKEAYVEHLVGPDSMVVGIK